MKLEDNWASLWKRYDHTMVANIFQQNLIFLNWSWNSFSIATPYIPQQNDVAKRTNRTLLDVVHFMISYLSLPISFWGYATQTIIYIYIYIFWIMFLLSLYLRHYMNYGLAINPICVIAKPRDVLFMLEN